LPHESFDEALVVLGEHRGNMVPFG
jgi:hypothetical protein